MKLYYSLGFSLFFSILSFGQFNSNAPWMAQFNQEDLKSNRIRFQEIVDAFDAYW